MKEFSGLELVKQLAEKEKLLLEAAEEASLRAHCPYSGIRVGAAILTAGGGVYTGANVENASFSLTICAERVAAMNAVCSGDKEFDLLAVVARDAAKLIPCGACLQFISEFCDDLRILLGAESGEVHSSSLSKLLPLSFRIENRGK